MLVHFQRFLLACVCFQTSSARKHGSSGCGKALPQGLVPGGYSRNFTIQSRSEPGGVTRRFSVYLPEHFGSSNRAAAPLVLAFHGQTQPTWSIETITNLSDAYFNTDAIAVFPEGLYYRSPGVSYNGLPWS